MLVVDSPWHLDYDLGITRRSCQVAHRMGGFSVFFSITSFARFRGERGLRASLSAKIDWRPAAPPPC